MTRTTVKPCDSFYTSTHSFWDITVFVKMLQNFLQIVSLVFTDLFLYSKEQ